MQLAASHEKECGLAAVAGSVTSGSSGSFTQLRMDDEERTQGHRAMITNANKKACGAETIAVADLRRRYIGPNHATMYDQPLHVVRGSGTTLYTADGREYLDCVNNVAHVGHCHPKVANAVAAQLGVLNTNSRYLHENFSGHAAALAATMPEQLGLMYATCSGSESNDLALRVAKKANLHGAMHVIVMDGAYHGHTSATMDLSPYKFNGPGGNGQPAHVQVMPCPDLLRLENLDGGAAARAAIMRIREAGGRVCAFFSESILSCGGQVVLPPGYLQAVYAEMRNEGAVCVADEVQCGFGRVGTHFWGFETQGVVPDMVTLGKPIGNGFPMGAVIMTSALANAFDNGEQYFATCGGCTAAGAAGLAVLQVIEEEGLQQAAQEVGAHLLARLELLQQGRPYLGDVRGLGLMVGIEVVTDGHSLARAPKLSHWIKEEMKLRRVLLTTDGLETLWSCDPDAVAFSFQPVVCRSGVPLNYSGAHCDNILKIKPPLVFSRGDAMRLAEELQAVLECFDALPGRERNALLEPWVAPAGPLRDCPPAAAAIQPGATQKKRKILKDFPSPAS